MKTAYPLTGLILMTCAVSVSHAAESEPACNMLGREVALRAAEQLDAGIDADKRMQLAAIAEEVCLQYRNYRPAGTVGNANVRDMQNPAANSQSDAKAEAEEEDGGLFSFRRIDPEDRVKRPGLKRP